MLLSSTSKNKHRKRTSKFSIKSKKDHNRQQRIHNHKENNPKPCENTTILAGDNNRIKLDYINADISTNLPVSSANSLKPITIIRRRIKLCCWSRSGAFINNRNTMLAFLALRTRNDIHNRLLCIRLVRLSFSFRIKVHFRIALRVCLSRILFYDP